MTTRHLYLASCVLAFLPSTAAAADLPFPQDSATARNTAAAEHYGLSIRTLNAWWQNPALQFDAYTGTYGRLGLYADLQWEEQAFVMQEGNARRHLGLRAASYRRLNGSPDTPSSRERTAIVVWGEASYRRGLREQVRWNASADWSAVRPYVLADTLGGDRHTERYAFQGGCATRLGSWTLGEAIDFRAEHEWSTRDPRMRSIVTDLSARLGLGRQMLRHELALGGTLRLYKQTNSVDFYREEGKIPEYQMTGLGNWYERFSGTNNSAYYQATGTSIDLGLRPLCRRTGLLCSAAYEYIPYRRILSSLNALPISRLYVTRWHTRIGWKGQAVKDLADFRLWCGIDNEKRRGDEIIGGESMADQYAVRGYLTMYHNRITNLHLGALFHLSLTSRDALSLHLQGGRLRYTSSYAYPHSALNYRRNYLDAALQWQTVGPRYLLILDVACRHSRNVSGAFISTPDDSYTSPLKKDVAEARRRMTEQVATQTLASYTELSCGFHSEWQPRFMGSNMGWFAEARAAYRRNDAAGGNNDCALHTSIGLTF